MSIQFTNDATTFLAANINASVTTITVVDASSFPTLASGDHTYITLSTPTNSTKEIVKCTAIVGNTLTVIRAQEGTTAASFTTDDRAQIRITAQLFRDIMLAYASLNSYRYTATAGQTTFTGTDIHSATLAYLPNNIIVMLNGVGMGTVDYTATDGSSIVFNVGATLNDEITIVAFTAFGVSDHYKKSETDALLAGKVDDSQVLTNVPSGALFTDTAYTHPANHAISVITGLQAALDGKVDDSQVLTNVPSGALFTDTNTVYTHPSNHAISVITGLQAALDGKTTESYVNTAVSNLVDSSPATLNTLNELAAALGDDANFSTTVTNSITLKAPIASPVFTGNVAVGTSSITNHGYESQVQVGGASNAHLGIKGGSNEFGLAVNGGALIRNYANTPMKFYTNNTERMQITSTGNVGVGVTPETWSTTGVVQVGRVSLTGTPSAIGGSLNWNAYYNSGWKYKDSLQAGSMTLDNGKFTFKVAPSGTADAAISWTTGLEVLNDGKARAKNGLLFGTDTAAANALDDYEEGTWTPVIQNTTGTFITSEAFNYVKVGKVVTTRGYIYNGNVASASAVWQFGGLPFQPLREAYGVVQFYVVNIPGDSAWVNVYANPTSSYIRLIATRDAGTSDSLQWSDVGTGHVDFHLTYLTT